MMEISPFSVESQGERVSPGGIEGGERKLCLTYSRIIKKPTELCNTVFNK